MLSELADLRKLTLLLGGRGAPDEMSSPTLETLHILRVEGLTTLGDLSRFPAQRRLQIEDQLQLASLDLTGQKLDRLHLYNCNTLHQLAGLDGQDRLQSVLVSKTAPDMHALRDRTWPATLQRIVLWSSRQTWNDATEALFAAQGIDEQGFLWSERREF